MSGVDYYFIMQDGSKFKVHSCARISLSDRLFFTCIGSCLTHFIGPQVLFKFAPYFYVSVEKGMEREVESVVKLLKSRLATPCTICTHYQADLLRICTSYGVNLSRRSLMWCTKICGILICQTIWLATRPPRFSSSSAISRSVTHSCLYMFACAFVCICLHVLLFVYVCMCFCLYMFACAFVCSCDFQSVSCSFSLPLSL